MKLFFKNYFFLTADCLSIHNKKRALHQDTDPLTYDTSIQASAQAYADEMARTGNFKHDPNRGNVGENLYYAGKSREFTDEEIKKSCTDATIAW